MRSIWTGTINFLLVSIPVKIYNAIETSEKISFNQLHGGDCLGPIGQKKQCKKCEAFVSNDEIVKGFQHDKDQYVLVTAEEISTIAPKSNESIEILGFVTREEIPTTYFDASYFAAPNGAAAGKAYSLLRDVMHRSGRIAIGKVILREHEELITISPNSDGLILQKLHYRHEVRSMTSVPGLQTLPATNHSELELAQSLLANMIITFDEIDTVDHYHAALKQMLETKIAGGTIEVNATQTSAAPVVDIMTALKASLKSKQAAAVTVNNDSPTAPSTNSPALTLLPPPIATARTKKRKTA